MNIMEQLKPKTPSKKVQSKVQVKKAEIAEVAEQELPKVTPAPTKVTDLDSGTISDISAISDDSVLSLLAISSMCNMYLQYNTEYLKLDDKYQSKFSTEVEKIYYTKEYELYHELTDYLKHKYRSMDISFEIDIMNLDVQKYKVKDTIYFLDNTVYIQNELDDIIDYIIKDIDRINKIHNLKTNNARDMRETTTLEIMGINTKHCSTCYYFSICDRI